MAHKRTWYLMIFLCVSTVLSLILLWCQLSQIPGDIGGGWSWVLLLSSSRGRGVDFSSLFSRDLQEPICPAGQVLIILVTSHPGHLEARKVIRKTWAAPHPQDVYHWQVVFLLGRTVDVELDWQMHNEQKAYGDLLMGNYLDSYRNLSLKVMHGIKWATDRCRPQYILKTDDDCFVNTNRLAPFLVQHNPFKTGLYVGSSFSRDKRVVIRDPLSKWFVSQQDFGSDVYPPYASGVGYILSLDVARKVLRAAADVPVIPVEDAFFGILAERAGIKLLSSSRFAKHNIRWSVCNYRYLMVIHRMLPKDQQLAQDNVRRAIITCAGNKEVTHWK